MKETLSLLTSRVDSQQCEHPAFKNNDNRCAVCKKTKTECSNPTTLVFRYIDPNLSLTIDAIRLLRDLNLQHLLDRKKLHLVLDLDNTLIHSIDAEKKVANNKKKNDKSPNDEKGKGKGKSKTKGHDDDVYEILKGRTLVKLRPGARNFLEKASQLFDLSIYTMADEPYARQVAKILESDTVHFTRVISRDDCIQMYRKGLDIVLSHQRVVLIVDDLDEIWRLEDRGNVIKIKPYTFYQKGGSSTGPGSGPDEDQELARVFGVLQAVHIKFYDKREGNYHAAKDVRQFLKKVCMGNSNSRTSK